MSTWEKTFILSFCIEGVSNTFGYNMAFKSNYFELKGTIVLSSQSETLTNNGISLYFLTEPSLPQWVGSEMMTLDDSAK